MAERDPYDPKDPEATGDAAWESQGCRYRIGRPIGFFGQPAIEWWDGGSFPLWVPRDGSTPAARKILADAAEIKRLRRLVSCAIQTCQHLDDSVRRSEPGPLTGPTWHKVSFLCGVGSTSANELCREFGADPDLDCHAELESAYGEEEGGEDG